MAALTADERLANIQETLDDLMGVEVYATQGGGVVTWSAEAVRPGTDQPGWYVWRELPDWYAECGITEKIGDPMPSEWGVIPINDAARRAGDENWV